MEDLGAGGTVSELISCHGINYGNERTRHMLKLFPNEKNIGLQLFGEDGPAMAQAAQVAQDFGQNLLISIWVVRFEKLSPKVEARHY